MGDHKRTEQREAVFWKIAYDFGEWVRKCSDVVHKKVRAYALDPDNTSSVLKSLAYLVRFHDEMLASNPDRARQQGLGGPLAPHFETNGQELEAAVEFAALFWITSLSLQCSQPKGRSETEKHWRVVAKRYKISHEPDGELHPITSLRAVEKYDVSRPTLRRAVAGRRLTDHRPPGHAPNSPLQLDEAEVANQWNLRLAAITARPPRN